jgi:hypothetical protein
MTGTTSQSNNSSSSSSSISGGAIGGIVAAVAIVVIAAMIVAALLYYKLKILKRPPGPQNVFSMDWDGRQNQDTQETVIRQDGGGYFDDGFGLGGNRFR